MTVNDEIQDLLHRYDLLSMSSGLEIRMPFLDWRLVSYALSLPATSILGNGFTKRILRDAMIPYLPPKILQRKRKLQFQGPVGQLLQQPLKSWVDSYPDLGRLAPEVLASGSYARISELGKRLIRTWQERTLPRLVQTRIAVLRQQHRSDPSVLNRNMQTM